MMRYRNFGRPLKPLLSNFGLLNFGYAFIENSINTGEINRVKLFATKATVITLETLIKKYCEQGEHSFKKFNPDIFLLLLTELKIKTNKPIDEIFIQSDIFSEMKEDQNSKTYPLLFFAAWHGQATIVQLLIEAGANPFLKNVDGMDPLTAAQKNNHDAVMFLLQSYYDLNIFIARFVESLSKLPNTSSISLFGYGLTAKNLALKESVAQQLKDVIAKRPLILKTAQEQVVLILNQYQHALISNKSIRYLSQLEEFLNIGKLSTIKHILLEHLDICLSKIKTSEIGSTENKEQKI